VPRYTHTRLSKLKTQYFQGYIEKRIVDNQHRKAEKQKEKENKSKEIVECSIMEKLYPTIVA